MEVVEYHLFYSYGMLEAERCVCLEHNPIHSPQTLPDLEWQVKNRQATRVILEIKCRFLHVI